METVICPNCGGKGILEDSAKVYHGRSYGMMYICENYPQCDSYVGVHKGTPRPLGVMANGELRTLKKQCHERFDEFWKSGAMSRQKAYRKLQRLMNLPPQKAHIGMFSVEQCRQLLEKLDSNVELNTIDERERRRYSEQHLRIPFD